MKITSMDVHRKEFGHAVRGYREDEVDDFLDAVAVELDRLNTQIEELGDRARQSESQALNFEAERNTINNALLTAQRASDEVLEQAKEKSQKLLEDADARAEKMLLAARQEREILLEDLKHLKAAEEKFRTGILEHAQETIDQLKTINVPRVPKRKEVPAAEVTTEDHEEDGSADTSIKAEETSSVKVVAPVSTSTVQVTPKTPDLQVKKEEGIGQFGEMELDEDLETID